MNKEKSKIFISYSRKDKDFALRLAEDLRAASIEIWIDQLDIPPGVRWDDAVEEALDLCKSFMVILSPVSVESEDVKDEIAYALDAGKQIIPVRYKECKIPLRIRRLNYIDFSSDYNAGKTKIIETIKKGQPLQAEPQIIKEEKPKESKKVAQIPAKEEEIPKPEVVKSKKTIFRSKPQELSEDDVISMLRKFSFADKYYNKNGKGLNHQYESETINSDKVVIDSASGLMWQQSGSENDMEYEDAKNWIKELNQNGFAGFDDWRIPTFEEAMSLMEPEKQNDLFINSIFNRKQQNIWTADQVKDQPWGWLILFFLGHCSNRTLGYGNYVRAVRSEQPLKDFNLAVNEEKPKEVKKIVKTPAKKMVPKPVIIKPKTTIFRSNPQALLEDDVKSMLMKYGFFDAKANKAGKGFNHQYEQKTIKGDKVAIDNASGLMWQQSGSSEQMTFENAKQWVKELNQKGFAGFNDWRLPTLEEAMSLIEPEEANKLYIDPIFDRKQYWIWTADQVKGESWAWVVYFDVGGCDDLAFSFNYYVRAVRSGKSSTE